MVRRDDTDWIRLAHYRNQWLSVVVAMEKVNVTFCFIKLEEFINQLSSYQLHRKTLPHSYSIIIASIPTREQKDETAKHA